MQKYVLIYFLILLFSTVAGQTIKLEHDLSVSKSSEKYGDKIDIAKKLQALDPFNYRATEYICRYYKNRSIDSISIYFNNLIAMFPNNTEPYLLRTEFLFLEHNSRDRDNYNILKTKYLTLALNINKLDQKTISKLAEVYYKDFIYPFEKEMDWGFGFESKDHLIDSTIISKEPKKQSTFEHPADSALMYFYKLWDLKKEKREIIYYPIKQLECYLHKFESSKIAKDSDRNFEQCFFPSWYFANLSKNWQCDNTVDYLFAIKSAKGTASWLKMQLSDLNEECLFNKDVQPNSIVYRFTWLRTFNNPIVIRIEKTNNEILLNWKVGKGLGGYEPKGLKTSDTKKLNMSDWDIFQKLILESNFDNLPNEKYVPMTDGATWTMEKKTSNAFKAHNTNCPGEEIKKACLFLLNLTTIKVKDKDIY
jgi:hypothetical protein